MSATTAAPQPASVSPLRGPLIRHPLVSFFTLAYALTWLAWSPWFPPKDGIGLLPYGAEGISDYLNTVALILGAAPTVTGSIANVVIGFGVAALLIVALIRGRLGYRRLDLD